MTRRLLTAMVGLPILWAAIWSGLPWLTILVGVAVLVGVRELYGMSFGRPIHPLMAAGVLWAASMVILGHFADDWHRYGTHMALGGGLLLVLPWLLVKRMGAGVMLAVLGTAYIGFLMAHPLMLRGLDSGAGYARDWTYLAVAVVFATDTGAYATGRLLGKHPMAPTVSPGKTWEGAVGGFLWALAAGLALHILLDLGVSMWQSLVVAGAAGIAAQVGDLVESKVKRTAGVKDAGALLPGHGGILDRLDSIALAIPVVYYLVAFALKPSTGT